MRAGESSEHACSNARENRLQRADDNFAKACLPGQDLAQTQSFESTLDPARRPRAPTRSWSRTSRSTAVRDQQRPQQRPGVLGNGSSTTSGCHDITAYPAKDIAAGACMGDGVLLDISDRENPVVTERVRDTTNFAFWHSATFNNHGTKVLFNDELGGGGAPTCNPEIGPNRGADGIYDINDGRLVFKSYYKISRTQANTENCVAHNGSLIPVNGKDIMVQAWYQGGISVFDFTNSRKPREIAWFDRGPLPEGGIGGSWSAYYYNGYIYSNDIQKGFDVIKVDDKLVNRGERNRMDVFNPQSQPSYNG